MIKVQSLSKSFKFYRSPADRLKEIFLRKSYHTDFQALKNITFEVADGETLGIIGQNGAGKSTLLKILCGVLLQDEGSIISDGKITGLLELGTGFNYEMTGVENIYMNGLLLSMSREEIDLQKDEVIKFTELGDFIYEPIKTYSSGMVMRLAFSIAIHANPRCFLVDEALSVGDAHFQQKCMRKIKDFRESGGSIVFVSHDVNAVKMICDKALLLNQGEIIEQGLPEPVVNKYNFLIAKLNETENKTVLFNQQDSSYGTFEAKITSLSITGDDSRSNIISSGEYASIAVGINADKDIKHVTVGISIRDKYGQDIFGTNTYYHNKRLNLQSGNKYQCSFKMQMNIGPGKYTLTCALHAGETHTEKCYHWSDNIAAFEVVGQTNEFFIGLCRLNPEIVFRKI